MNDVGDSGYYVVEDAVAYMLDRREDRFRWYADHALAVVDEVGARAGHSDLIYSALKRFADLREHAPTIWISNLPPDAIAELYDDRILSRLCSGTCFELLGPDRRFA